jgi:AraC family transcriptional activator of pobA
MVKKSDAIKVLGIQQFTSENTHFYVKTLAEHLKTSHLHIEKPHKHDFFACMLFTHGSGMHEIDFNSYDVKPGAVFLLSPGQTHHWELSKDCDGIIFFHSKDFYDTHYLHQTLKDFPFFSTIQNQAAIFLGHHKLQEIWPLFEKVLEIGSDGKIKGKELILSVITQIYIELERFITTDDAGNINEHSSYYLKFLQFEKLVEEHFRSEKSANQYANWMHMTPKHLNRINKSIVNKTSSEVIADRIILEAKRMLIYARNNFNEVADALGFADYAHFSKLFKNKTGLTPTEFFKKYV